MVKDDDSAKLLEGLRQGSRKARAETLRRYGGYVAAVVGVMLRDPRDVEEVVQDTFLGAFRDIGSYDGSAASLATWLRSIAYHRAVDFLRRRNLPLESLPEHLAEELPEEPPDLGDDVEALTRALLTLAPADRSLLTMVYFDDLPLKDVAYITGTNPTALAAKLYRLRNKLAQTINAQRNRQ